MPIQETKTQVKSKIDTLLNVYLAIHVFAFAALAGYGIFALANFTQSEQGEAIAILVDQARGYGC